MKTLILAAVVISIPYLFIGNAQATGLLTCGSGNQSNWQSQKALSSKIISAGWQVRRIKIDGGCYEVYGTTPEGDRVEAYFHPVTLEKLLVARRGKILFKKENTLETGQ